MLMTTADDSNQTVHAEPHDEVSDKPGTLNCRKWLTGRRWQTRTLWRWACALEGRWPLLAESSRSAEPASPF